MISSVRGTVLHSDVDSVVIEVGGVGLEVAVTPQVARNAHVGEPLMLHTSLIVREDALSLFGFETREELAVFSDLLGVTGVGPKSALGVLATLTVAQIADAIAADDEAAFRRVSGIGPKTAKLIVVQLTGRIVAAAASSQPLAASPVISDQVVQALAGLGWPDRVAREAVAAVAGTASESDRASVQALLRLTLGALGPARKEIVHG